MTQHEVVKYRGNTLSTKNKRSLLTLTDAILKTATTARQSNELIVDDSWFYQICLWADEFEIPEEDIPRNKEGLLALTSLKLNRHWSVIQNTTLTPVTYLPEAIGQLTNLLKLELICNELYTLPQSIGSLNKLEELEIRDLYLTELPESIGKLKCLIKLMIIDSYELKVLPDSIGQLSSLQELDIYCGGLTKLTESISELSNLQELCILHTELTELPESIGQMTNLKRLLIRDNNVAHLPDGIVNLNNTEVIFD